MEWIARLLAASNPLWYYWPLAFVIGAVYKTTQYDEPCDIIKGTLHFVGSVTAFMLVLGVGLFVVNEWIAGG